MRPAWILTTAAFTAGLSWSAPPGATLGEIGPNQASVGIFYDHSGQDLYESPAASVLNTAGVVAEYGPLPYFQIGAFAGGAEFDVAVPDTRQGDSDAKGFDSDYSALFGGLVKATSPRFVDGTMRVTGFGQASYFNAEDPAGNSRRGLYYLAGGALQWEWRRKLNIAVGGEWRAIDGTQENSLGDDAPFGLNNASGTEAFRALLAFEYTFAGKNKPFVSLVLRSGGEPDWDDDLGIRNASICLTMGAIATFAKSAQDLPPEEDDRNPFAD